MNTRYPRANLRLYGLVFLSLVLLDLFWPLPASAHALRTDGQIAGVLHTEPDDQPLSNTPTVYVLYISDSSGRFSLAKCRCTLTITRNGHTIATQPLRLGTQQTPGGSFTFPTPGAYQLIFNGTPLAAHAFQPFTLDYPEQVGQGPKDASALSKLWLGLGTGLIVVALAVCWLQIRQSSVHK